MKYKLIHEKRTVDGSNYKVARSELRLKYGEVNIEGSRAVDNGKFVVDGGHTMTTDDNIAFISDDVNIDRLAFAMNFYYNIRDESGYNIDGHRIDSSSDPNYGLETDNNRYQGHKYLDCTDNTQVIRCKQSEYENNKNAIDFEDGREIQLHIKTPVSNTWSANEKQIIFSRIDSHAGIEIGLKRNSSNNQTYAYIKQRAWNGSSADNQETGTTDSDYAVDDNAVVYLRAYKVDDVSSQSKYKQTYLKVDNRTGVGIVRHGSSSYKLEENNVTKDIYLCSDSSSGNKFEGRLYSVRCFNEELNSNDASVTWTRMLPQHTMKFAGKISDITHRKGTLVLQAVGWSSILLSTELDREFFTTGNSENSGTSGIYRYDDSSTATKKHTLLENIVDDIILNYNTNKIDSTGENLSNGHLGKDIKFLFSYNNPDDEDDETSYNTNTGLGFDETTVMHVRNMKRFNAGGRFVDVVRILAALGGKQYKHVLSDDIETDASNVLVHDNGADQFFMLPRKVLIFESSNIENNSYFSVDHGYRIEDDGFDDSNIYNHITVVFKEFLSNVLIEVDANAKTNDGSGFNIQKYFDESNQALKKKFIYLERIDVQTGSGSPSASNIVTLEGQTTAGDHTDYTVNADSLITWGSSITSSSSDKIRIFCKAYDFNLSGVYNHDQNNKSIELHGLKSKKFFVPQIDDAPAMQAFTRRLLGSKGESEKNAMLLIPRLMNSLGIGMRTTVDHMGKHLYNEEFVVKKIVYKFPKSQTIVYLGDFAYDVMDDFKAITQDIAGIHNQNTDTN